LLKAGRKRVDRSALEGKGIEAFREAIKSKVTLDVYERRLNLFLTWANLTADEFVDNAKRNQKEAQELILKYLLLQKGRALRREISPSTVTGLRKPLKLFLEMNDVTGINWSKVSRLMPRERRYALDRAPTVDELRMILTNSDLRLQAILLVMASSGIRLGAWDYLNIGHVHPIYKDKELVAAKLSVYLGEPEEYISFLTPEAYRKVEEYIDFRKKYGEKIGPDAPLVRDKWQAPSHGGFTGKITNPKRLDSFGVKRLIEDTLWKLKLRTEKKKRHEFSIHSIRKFFKTRAEQAMRPINVETLMGHSTGISDSYYRPTEKELLEDYLKALPLLSISESEELKRVVQVEQRVNAERLRQLESTVNQLTALLASQVRDKESQALALDHSRTQGT